MSSSTRPTSSTSRRRTCATMPPTVCSSSRAGSTTLIRLAPLARTTRCSVHDSPRLLRRDNQFHTSGSTPAGMCSSPSRMTPEVPLTSASNPPQRVAYWRRVGVPVKRRRPGRMHFGSLQGWVCGSRWCCRAPRAPSHPAEGCTDRRRDRPQYGGCTVICRDDGRRRGFGPGGTHQHIAGCGVCLCSAARPWRYRGTGTRCRHRIVCREAAGAGPADRRAHRRHGAQGRRRYRGRSSLALFAGRRSRPGTTRWPTHSAGGGVMDRPRAPGAVVEHAGAVGRSDRRAGGACTWI